MTTAPATTYTSSDTRIVTIEHGYLRAMAVGEASVTVRNAGIAATVPVTVEPDSDSH